VTSSSTATLESVSKTGGPPLTLAALTGVVVEGLATIDDDVYVGTFGGPPTSEVAHVPLVGGPVDVLASGANDLGGIAVDETNVYWSESGPSNGQVWRIARAGGAAEPIAMGFSPWAVAAYAGNVYFTDLGMCSTCMNGSVSTVPAGGGNAAALTPLTGQPWTLAVDSSGVYFSDDTAGGNVGSLSSVPLGGGTIDTLSAGYDGSVWGIGGNSNLGLVAALALDATHVYFFAGGVLYVRTKGSADDTEPFAPAMPGSGRGLVATDPTCVYWATGSTLYKAPLAP
jgi:hypothetical protein